MLFAPLVIFVGLSLAGAQTPAPSAEPASIHAPITVDLMTVMDFPDVLGGQRIRVPRLEVKRVLGPRVVVVWRASTIETDRTSRGMFSYDHLIVLLPSPVNVPGRQMITVTGDVRTTEAARAAGVRLDQEIMDKKAYKNMPWPTRRLVLVADTVQTEDGVTLAVAR